MDKMRWVTAQGTTRVEPLSVSLVGWVTAWGTTHVELLSTYPLLSLMSMVSGEDLGWVTV